MGLACQIFKNEDGSVNRVDAPNGEKSYLYDKALGAIGNDALALDVWATAYTPGFRSYYGYWDSPMPGEFFDTDVNGEPRYEDVMAYINRENTVVYPLNMKDMSEVRDMAISIGESDIRGISDTIRSSFMQTGRVIVNETNLRNSGMYSEYEILNILGNEELSESVRSSLSRIIDAVDYMHDEDKALYYTGGADKFPDFCMINKEGFNSLGKQNMYNPGRLYEYLKERLGGISDIYEMDNIVYSMESEYPEFVAEYSSSDSMRQDVFNEFRRMTRVKEMSINENGEISEVKSKRLQMIHAYSFTNIPALKRMRKLIFDFYDSESNPESVLKAIEKEAANFGIDIVGISDAYKSGRKNEVVEVLNTFDDHIEGMHKGDYSLEEPLAEELDAVLGSEPTGKVIDVLETEESDLFSYVKTNLSDKEMFERYNLIHVGNGVYRSCDKIENKEEVYESIADIAIENPGALNLPESAYPEEVFDNGTVSEEKLSRMEDAEPVIESIRKYILSLTGADSTEEMELGRLVFQLKNVPGGKFPKNMQRALNRFRTRKGKGLNVNTPRDLYVAKIKNKAEKSDVYDSLYANLEFSPDMDINLVSSDAYTRASVDSAAEGVARKRLQDYAMESENDSLFDLFFINNYSLDMAENDFYHYYYMRNPEALSEVKNTNIIEMQDGEVMVENVYSDFVKINGNVYSKVNEGNEGSVYKIIGANENYNYEVYEKSKPSYVGKRNEAVEPKAKDLMSIDENEMNEINRKLEC